VYLLFGAALAFNLSRSGVLIWIGGPLLWVIACVAAKQLRAMEGLRLGLALSLACVLFAIFGGKTFRRFGDVPETVAGDYRALIQKDALQMASAASLVGVGAGNFESVFPFHRVASQNEKRALHPEGDWVCLAAEMGWLAVPLAWALLLWCVWRACRIESQSDPRLMLAAATAGLCLWLHGFVDMNAHRMGAVWPALMLLAVAQPRPIQEGEKFSRSRAWRVVLAVLAILVALAWLGPSLGLKIPGTTRRRALDREFSRSNCSTGVSIFNAHGSRWPVTTTRMPRLPTLPAPANSSRISPSFRCSNSATGGNSDGPRRPNSRSRNVSVAAGGPRRCSITFSHTSKMTPASCARCSSPRREPPPRNCDFSEMRRPICFRRCST
jgi:hypothetical protein